MGMRASIPSRHKASLWAKRSRRAVFAIEACTEVIQALTVLVWASRALILSLLALLLILRVAFQYF